MVRKRASAATVPGSFCRTGTFHFEEMYVLEHFRSLRGLLKSPNADAAELEFPAAPTIERCLNLVIKRAQGAEQGIRGGEMAYKVPNAA